MPGPIIPDPTPAWLKPENASVTDTALTKAMRMIGHLIGADNPTAQVLGLMMTDVPGGSATGGLAKAVEGLKARVIKAYHGSPHDFERFSLEKIGTGEGAQAYGHGLYFAENEGTARSYRDQLSKFGYTSSMPDDMSTSVLLDNKVVSGHEPSNKLTALQRAALSKHYAGGVQAQAIKDVEESLKYMTPGTEAHRLDSETLDVLKNTDLTGRVKPFSGRMYEVAIHADPEDFLDWDKPLSQQSEKVKQIIEQSVPNAREPVVMVSDRPFHEWAKVGQWAGNDPTGTKGFDLVRAKYSVALKNNDGDIEKAIAQVKPALANASRDINNYADELAQGLRQVKPDVHVRTAGIDWRRPASDLVHQAKSTPEAVAQSLRQAGLPGIKYLDQGSRAAGEGSRNYVVFDDKLIDILKKYGLLLPAAGAATQGQTLISPRGPQ